MVELSERSFDQLAHQAIQLDLLDDYRTLEPFIYLEVNAKRYVFDRTMARTFLLGLIDGASCRRREERLLPVSFSAQRREPVLPARG